MFSGLMSRWITPWRVRVIQRGGDLPHDADRLVDRELLLAGEPLPQRLARDVGHDVVEQVMPRPLRPESCSGRMCG